MSTVFLIRFFLLSLGFFSSCLLFARVYARNKIVLHAFNNNNNNNKMSAEGDTERERDKVCKCMCVTGKWRTKMFSMADGSLSNLFTTHKGKASVE